MRQAVSTGRLSPCRRVLMPLAVLTAALSPERAFSQDVASFYRGKTIRLIVGYSAGGGHDAYARLLARFIGQYIPGNPRIVVENMPGASTVRAVQYLDNAPPDGTMFAAVNSGLVTQSLTKPDEFPVNLSKYAWIGSISQEIRICYVRADFGIQTWNDLLRSSQIVFGETGRGSASYIDGGILKEIFGVKLKVILGYAGGAEKLIAIERKELDGDCTSFSTVPRDWVLTGKVKVLSRGSTVSVPDLPADTPYIMDLTGDAHKKTLIKFLLSPSVVGRPYIASKAVPVGRIAALQAAFNAAVKDPQLLEQASKLQLPVVGPMTGQEAASYVAEMYQAGPDVISAARKIID
jgi:tripartite-type tricarboxylate transporter receptor subunit TctC